MSKKYGYISLTVPTDSYQIKENSKHPKPTTPFGTYIFSKDGKVRKDISILPPIKEKQELEVTKKFVDMVSRHYDRNLLNIKQLNENNHDCFVQEKKDNIEIQVTELKNFDFAKKIGNGAYSLDMEKEALALKNTIEKKINKMYQKPLNNKLWLLIFSTYFYTTIYNKNEKSRGLINAENYLKNNNKNIFDEIWFLDLISRPTQIFKKKNGA